MAERHEYLPRIEELALNAAARIEFRTIDPRKPDSDAPERGV